MLTNIKIILGLIMLLLISSCSIYEKEEIYKNNVTIKTNDGNGSKINSPGNEATKIGTNSDVDDDIEIITSSDEPNIIK